MIGSDGRSQPRAVPGPAGAARFRARALSDRLAFVLERRVGRQRGDSRPGDATPTPAAEAAASRRPRKSKGPRFYMVKAGDTPSAIAEKTGVPLTTIRAAQPRTRSAGALARRRIKLRK